MGESKAILAKLGTLTPSDEKFFEAFFTLDTLDRLNMYFKVLNDKSPRIRWHVLLKFFPLRFAYCDQVYLLIQSPEWPKWFTPLLFMPNPKTWKGDDQQSQLIESDLQYLHSFLVTLIFSVLQQVLRGGGLDDEPSSPTSPTTSSSSSSSSIAAIPMKETLHNFLNAFVDNAGWTEEVIASWRLILWGFAKTLIANWIRKGQPPDLKHHRQWRNVLELFSVIKEFIFFCPTLDAGMLSGKEKSKSKAPIPALHLGAHGCVDLPLIGKVVELIAGLLRKLERDLLDRSPKQEKEIVVLLADEAKFFILVYQALSPTKTVDAEESWEWHSEDERLQSLLSVLKKKKYPYPTPEELTGLLVSINPAVSKFREKENLHKFSKFASDTYFSSSYDELQRASTVQARPTEDYLSMPVSPTPRGSQSSPFAVPPSPPKPPEGVRPGGTLTKGAAAAAIAAAAAAEEKKQETEMPMFLPPRPTKPPAPLPKEEKKARENERNKQSLRINETPKFNSFLSVYLAAASSLSAKALAAAEVEVASPTRLGTSRLAPFTAAAATSSSSSSSSSSSTASSTASSTSSS